MNKLASYSMMILIGILNVGIWSNYDTPGAVAPLLRSKWNLTAADLGSAYSVYSFPNLVVPIAYGALTDWAGPMVGLPLFLMLSQLFILVASLMVWLCNGNIPVFLCGRLIMGLGGEYILLCQYAAAAKWFPINQLCVANALNMMVGMVALACLFNVFPLIASKSLTLAFGVSFLAAIIAVVLSVIYVCLHIWHTKKYRALAKKAPAGVDLDETSLPEGVSPAPVSSPMVSPMSPPGFDELYVVPTPGVNAELDDGAIIRNSMENASDRPSTDSRPSTDQTNVALTSTHLHLGVGAEKRKSIFAKSKDLVKGMFSNILRFPPIYWTLILCCGFNLGIVQSYIAFSTDLLTTKWGIDDENSARFSSIVVMSPIVFSLPIGIAVDKVGHRLTGFVIVAALMIAAFIALALLPGSTHVAVPCIALVVLGLMFSYVPTVEGSAFTMACPDGLLSTGIGISMVANMITTTVFPLVIGYLYDWKKSYTLGMLLLACASCFSCGAGVLAIFLDRGANKRGMERLQRPCAKMASHGH